MPGMSAGLKTNNSNIVAAFHSALLHQGLVVLLIAAVAGVTSERAALGAVPSGSQRRWWRLRVAAARPGVNRQLVASCASHSA